MECDQCQKSNLVGVECHPSLTFYARWQCAQLVIVEGNEMCTKDTQVIGKSTV